MGSQRVIGCHSTSYQIQIRVPGGDRRDINHSATLQVSPNHRSMATKSIARTSQKVTLPEIPQLFNPDFLNVLIPESKADAMDVNENKANVQAPTNPLMTALMTDNRTFTENMAPALSSTGSATLDAFNGLNAWSFKEVNKALENAWAEDPGVTLRIIWNMRSIHDGKGEKELFYR